MQTSSTPGTNQAGVATTSDIPSIATTTTAVQIARPRRRRPVASERWPSTGASTATTSPATASPAPSPLESPVVADSKAGVPGFNAGSTKRELVRYTVKTNVVMTALNAAPPQSHAAHAATRPRVEVACA